MFFRWDWLRPVLTAPIMPTLGIPTLTRRGRGTVKVFAYGIGNGVVEGAAELAAKLASVHDAASARVVRPLGPDSTHPRGTRVQLKDFTAAPCPAPDGPVRPITDWLTAVQETFAPFAKDMAADGLAFLHTQMQAGRCGPVLAAAVEDRIVGAIGPMEVRPDAAGCPQLMPQYFAVLPEARGQGLGRVLWRAAMHWGQSCGAAYQLLQTEVDGPSDRLCQSEGLTSLGFSHSTRA
ncbi:GNAT family N-acetyltransferase [Streptomyces sp. NPDC088124]|uniref:GNAT family N-acetyltransferase n=1 Tax=Streptomyces sp. NPDC088124 TaxID=3154654 RepID=UPI00341586C6